MINKRPRKSRGTPTKRSSTSRAVWSNPSSARASSTKPLAFGSKIFNKRWTGLTIPLSILRTTNVGTNVGTPQLISGGDLMSKRLHPNHSQGGRRSQHRERDRGPAAARKGGLQCQGGVEGREAPEVRRMRRLLGAYIHVNASQIGGELPNKGPGLKIDVPKSPRFRCFGVLLASIEGGKGPHEAALKSTRKGSKSSATRPIFLLVLELVLKMRVSARETALNDAGLVLLLSLTSSMQNNSSFGLTMGQSASLGLQSARFQLKMGIRAPFGHVWRQHRHEHRHQTPPRSTPTSKL